MGRMYPAIIFPVVVLVGGPVSGMQVGYGTAAVGQVRAKGRAANQSVEPH